MVFSYLTISASMTLVLLYFCSASQRRNLSTSFISFGMVNDNTARSSKIPTTGMIKSGTRSTGEIIYKIPSNGRIISIDFTGYNPFLQNFTILKISGIFRTNPLWLIASFAKLIFEYFIFVFVFITSTSYNFQIAYQCNIKFR